MSKRRDPSDRIQALTDEDFSPDIRLHDDGDSDEPEMGFAGDMFAGVGIVPDLSDIAELRVD